MKVVWDVETSFQITEHGKDPSPYHPANILVSVGAQTEEGKQHYWCINHTKQETSPDARLHIQELLDQTTLFIAHNTKFDLSWLLMCEFEYNGPLYDTMIFEYVVARGRKLALDLSSCCMRRGVPPKKKDEVMEYWNKGTSTQFIPWPVLKEYGLQDLDSCWQLFVEQQNEIQSWR